MNETSFWENYFIPLDNAQLASERRAFYRLLAASLNYIPWLLIFNALGFGLLYALTLFNLLGTSNTQLLLISVISLATGLLLLPLINIVKQNKLEVAAIGLLAIYGLGTGLQVFAWENSLPFVFIFVAAPLLYLLNTKALERRHKIITLGVSAVLIIIAVVGDVTIPYQRLNINNPAAIAGIIIYSSILVTMAFLIVATARFKFVTISARLATIFAVITVLSAIITISTVILVNLQRNQAVTLQQLQIITDAKHQQITSELNKLEENTKAILNDPSMGPRIQYLLEGDSKNQVYQFNYQIVKSELAKILAQTPVFLEIFLVDETGSVIVSTFSENEGRVLAGETFFQRILQDKKFTLEQEQTTKQQSLLIVTPVEKNKRLRGGLVVRTALDNLKTILSTVTAQETTQESYLVGSDYIAVSPTRGGENIEVRTQASENALSFRGQAGRIETSYPNYKQLGVFGYSTYIKEIEVALISEIEVAELTRSLLEILLATIGLGLFAALMSLTIVAISSRAISSPIADLANKARELAQGNLNIRADIDQKDEIGMLALTFNTVASELQTVIESLEQKVNERTDSLQIQANRLRVAAEVARDATTSRNIDELLNRASQMILDRFNFYHTGIFLVDSTEDYAVLRASPTEAGKIMLQRNHRLRVGRVGIVGYVAGTGEPRIALDTGEDTVHFQNPLLPNTRSEMALPLKVNDKVIGVLDVQSDKPGDFSQDDVASLQIMADQLALAIQRALLVEDLQNNLQELEHAYQRFTLSSWQSFADIEGKNVGYRFDGNQVVSLSQLSKDSQEAMRQGKHIVTPLTEKGESLGKVSLTVPVRLREQVIGAINLNMLTENVSQDTLRLADEISNRLAVALDNARLYTETQRQAQFERVAGDIANRIGASVNIENILRTAVVEFGRIMPSAEVTVRLNQEKEES